MSSLRSLHGNVEACCRRCSLHQVDVTRGHRGKEGLPGKEERKSVEQAMPIILCG